MIEKCQKCMSRKILSQENGENYTLTCGHCWEKIGEYPLFPRSTLSELSPKGKVRTTERIVEILAAIGELRITGEGVGGEIDYSNFGSGRPGSGLRAPDMALYNMPKSWRQSIIKELITRGLITGKKDDSTDDYADLAIAAKGKEALEAGRLCRICGERKVWYSYVGRSGNLKLGGRAFYCPHKAKEINGRGSRFAGNDGIGLTEMKLED